MEKYATRVDRLMQNWARSNNLIQYKFIYFDTRTSREKFFTYGVQCVAWPREEPVDSAAVDKGRELTKSLAERITDWGERKDDVQILFGSCNEEVVELCCVEIFVSIFSGVLANTYKLVSSSNSSCTAIAYNDSVQ